MNTSLRLGIDLGGTKTEIIALSADGRELLRERRPTPSGDYPATLQTIRSLVEHCEQRLGLRGSLGIAIPGTRSPDHGLIKNANSTCLNGRPLQEDLEALLGRPLRLANDADCLALSEACDGAGRNARSLFAVIIGTGVGGGLAINGQLIQGPNGIAGEWGHNPLPWRREDDGEPQPCYCGKNDCIETFLSGPGWARRSGLGLNAAELGRRIAAGDPQAMQALARYADQLARGLASVINILDPEVLVFGGGLSNIEALYPALAEALPRYIFSDQVNTRQARAQHGDSSGVRGAARLWPIASEQQ